MGSRRLPLSSILVVTAVSLVVAGVVVLVLGGASGDDDRDETSADGTGLQLTPQGEVPETVQAVELAALDGGPDRTLGELLDGRPLVVNFFGSWCQPCREEMPAFQRVHEDLGGQVQFVGLAEPPDTPDRPEAARELVEETGVTYPTFVDPHGAGATYFEVLGMPTTAFLSAAGEVLQVHTGELDEEGLRARIRDNFGVEA